MSVSMFATTNQVAVIETYGSKLKIFLNIFGHFGLKENLFNSIVWTKTKNLRKKLANVKYFL